MTDLKAVLLRKSLFVGFAGVLATVQSLSYGSDYAWDTEGVTAYERGDAMGLSASIHELNGYPYIGFSLFPYEAHSQCTYATVGEDAYHLMPYEFDGQIYEAYVFCEPDNGSHYYTFVTMDSDVQERIIERLATELGVVELRFDGMIFDLPTVGFNNAFKARLTQ